MTPVNLGKWADGDPLPSGNALRSAAFVGALVYGGTPGRTKNTTRAQRLDLQAAGLQLAAIYENGSTDINGGTSAGASHADALIQDLLNCGYPNTTPIAVAADEHLTASQVALGVQYQTGFYLEAKRRGWVGPVGGYGFSEYTQAIRNAGVADWEWQAGSQSALGTGITFWQDNTGYDTVAGHSVDRDWQLLAFGAIVTNPFSTYSAPAPILDENGNYTGQDAPTPTDFADDERFTNASVRWLVEHWVPSVNQALATIQTQLTAQTAAIAVLQSAPPQKLVYDLQVPPTS